MKKILVFLILAIGLTLRITGVNWGFPMLLHPDEHLVANVPADMAARSSCDPNLYERPDHLEIYANAAMYHIASFLRYSRPLTDTFAAHMTFYYLLSRMFVALLGTACIVVAYLIGKEYRWGAGIVAAALFAVFPSYVGHSHYITPEIPLTLCTLLTILFAVKYLKEPTSGKLLLLSIFPALAFSIKYPGALTLLLTMTVILCKQYRSLKKTFLELSKAFLLFFVFAFIFSPFVFINAQKAVHAVLFEARPDHLGADSLGWLGNVLFYADMYQLMSGIIVLLFCAVGVFYLVRDEKLHSIPLFFGFIYWILLSAVSLHWERWALPMYTAPLLISAYGIDAVYRSSMISHHAGKYLRLVCSAAIVAIIVRLLVESMVITAAFTLTDTRWASYQFTVAAGITEENALYEGYTPLYAGGSRTIFTPPDNLERIKFIVLSSHMYNRFFNERARYAEEIRFYQQVFSLPLIKEFETSDDDDFTDPSYWADYGVIKEIAFLVDYFRHKDALLSGPTIKIYQFKP